MRRRSSSWQEPGAPASSHLGRSGRDRKLGWAANPKTRPSHPLPPIRLHLLKVPNSATCWERGVQTGACGVFCPRDSSMWPFSMRSFTSSFLLLKTTSVQSRHVSVYVCRPLGESCFLLYSQAGHGLQSVFSSSLLVNIWVVSLTWYQEVALLLTEHECIWHLWRPQSAQADAPTQSQNSHTKWPQAPAFLATLGILGLWGQYTQDSVCVWKDHVVSPCKFSRPRRYVY